MKPHQPFAVAPVLLAFVSILAGTGNRVGAQGVCAGDCNQNDRVTVDELVTGVNIALDMMPVDRCRALDLGGDDRVTVNELVMAVNATLVGCGPQANRAPQASAVSFNADPATSYVEKQLIGTDPDHDTITYELVADESGNGYSFAYLNPESGVLYVTLEGDFHGTIVLPYRVTDGRLFSKSANATLEVDEAPPSGFGGVEHIDPREYASHPRGFYYGALLGAPGEDPTLPSSVDLSNDFPLPGDQGNQNSCVGWALGYAIKSYQERLELGWSLDPLEHRFSPAYIYNQLNGGVDNGLIYHQALDFVVDQGVATLARMPYNDNDFWSQPSTAAHQEAAKFKDKSWKPANGVLDIKAALANRLPVFMVIQLVSDIHYLRGPDSVYNTFNGRFEGGHAVTAVGYDDNRYGGAFRIMNSWGRNWGDGGYFWMPYWTTTHIVDADLGPSPILTGGVVIEDLPDPYIPDTDPVDPPPAGQLPDLQVTNWNTNYNGTPGGAGILQYTVTNTGVVTAPAGGYVALVVSRDPTFKSGNTLVVYESIPFDMAPGTTVYRDANNTIAFNFPDNLEPGQYHMALWADIWDDVVESNDNDNISPGTTVVDIVNTLPDMTVIDWYANWDELGLGALTYNVVNNGASTAPTGWLVTLALSPDDIMGDGDETFLFSETANFALAPGGTLYRNDASAGRFSLYFDAYGNAVPDGAYYIGLWLDPNGYLAESNEYNNASLSWGTIGIGGGGGASAGMENDGAGESTSVMPGEAYNGKTLPQEPRSVRRVRLSTTPEGSRRLESLDADVAPQVKEADSPRWSKEAHARQQVIFPVGEMKPMPAH